MRDQLAQFRRGLEGSGWPAGALVGEFHEHVARFGVPGLVRRQVELTPDAIACVDATGELTYRELDLLSDRLAGLIADSTGGGRGAVVVNVPRGVGLAVALLGVLKSGCWYLPVSSAEPETRLATMVTDADPVAVVTDGPPPGPARHLPVVEVPDAPAPGQTQSHLREVPPDQPVYVLFTSGSTGIPKGVLLGSGALCNRLMWMQRQYGLTSTDTVLQKTPVTFDVSGWEIFWPLIAGARSVYAPHDAARDATAVSELVATHEVTVCHFVPSMLEELLRSGNLRACASLRLVFCSGEALSAGLAARFVRALDASLHNLYGPTEAAIDVSHWAVPTSCGPEDTVYIGAPVDNTALLAVDVDQEPVPDGATGELWIAGAQLALGYVNRPAVTAAAFVERFGHRWYRTGDLVRISDGRIEYLGRADEQVKIRGVRVEPGEVEVALSRHPAVGSAVVVAVPAVRTAGYELVAALTAAAEIRATAAELSSFVAAHVPPAFVPSAYRWFGELPLTQNGKADRRAIRAALTGWWRSPGAGDGADAISALWWDVLRCPEDGDAESLRFMELGGHSLTAARLIGRAAHEFGVRVSFAVLLRDNPSLAEFRSWLAGTTPERQGTAEHDTPVLPRRVPLAPGQRRLWLLHRLDPSSSDYNVVVALRVRGAVSPDALRGALARLAARHDALRARVRVDQSGRPWLSFATTARPRLEVRSTPNLDDGVTAAFVNEFAARAIPMTESPMMFAGLLRAARGDTACLVLCLHHLIADQHSMDLLVAELGQAYHAEVEGGAPWPGPAPSFAAYAMAHAEAADDETAQRMRYWTGVLADAPHEIVLPVSGAPTRGGSRGRRTRRVIGTRHSGLVDHMARTRGVTSAGIVLAALVAVLSAWAGQTTVVIGSPASRRRTPAEQRMVGFLVDTLPIRVDVAPGGSFGELVAHVHERYVGALDNAVPEFDELVDQLAVPRRAGVNPVFQVWFNDVSRSGSPTSTQDFRVESIDAATGQALFDVNFYLSRDGAEYALELVHRLDRISADAADELVDQSILVLAQVLERPDMPVEDLDLRTGRARALSDGEPWEAHHATVADLVEGVLEAAAPRPDAPAFIEASGQVLTYGWLAREISLVGAELRQLGVRPGTVVEIRWTRSAWLVPALLGTWRLGAVPALLDAALPESRLAAQSATLRPAAFVRVPAGATSRPAVERGVDEPRLLPGAGHVLFTSGTTGAPAAVVAPDTALANAMAWYQKEFAPTAADRAALLSAPGHDPVLRDLLSVLLVGGTVVVPPPDVAAKPARLIDFLRDLAPTIVHATPALLELLLATYDERRPVHLSALRLVISGGAPLPGAFVRRLRMLTGAAIVNAYGATETPQIAARFRTLDAGEPAGRLGERTVPIGRGVAGAELAVVTATGGPAGIGQLGELVVIGEQLATGYLDDTGPGERFHEVDPAHPRRRGFRTGDLARLDPAGLVHLAGRRDRQVSVNGFRVDLAEVEGAAAEHPGVRSARADWVRVGNDEVIRLLVAGDVDVTSVRRHLRALLPAAAVPTRIDLAVDLDGPVNHKGSSRDGPPLVLPPSSSPAGREDVEQVLRTNLRALVGLDLRVAENFFDAGLNSISLVRLHHVLQKRFQPFPVTSLFEHPNIAALAAFLSGRPVAAPTDRTVPRPSGTPGLAARRRALRRSIEEGGLRT